MNIFELIQLLHRKKIKVEVNNNKLQIDAPKGAVTTEIMFLLKKNKNKLINYFSISNNNENEIPIADRDNHLKLSYAQQRLWFIDQLDEGSVQYNMPSAMRISGDFDVKAAEQAFIHIIERHESLRTIFLDSNNGPVQVIQNKFNFTLNEVNLCGMDQENQNKIIETMISKDTEKTFDLNQDLMLRVSFLRTDQRSGILLFNMHHIASDGWSIGILINEFITLYESNLNGLSNSLAPLPIQYADYASWQRKWLTKEVLERQLSYWKKKLIDIPQVHNLSLDFERPQYQTFNGNLHHFSLDIETSQKLKAIALKQEVTLFMLLHAVFSILLSRYSNRTDIVIGTPVANRAHKQLESLIGFFVNTLILRSDCSDNIPFADYLKQIKDLNIKAQANQDIPFENIVECLNPERSTAHNALFQIMLNMDNNASSEFVLPDLKLVPQHNKNHIVKFDLSLHVEGNDSCIQFSIYYNTDLFKLSTITKYAESFQLLINGIINDIETPIQRLPVVSQSEFNYLTKELNNTQKDNNDLCFHQIFENQVSKTPNSVAVKFKDKKLTYSELNDKANRLAHNIQNTGIKPNNRVAIYMFRSIEMLISILAIMKTGASYVPLEPKHPKNRLSYIIEDANVDLLLTTKDISCPVSSKKLRQLIIDDLHDNQWLSNFPDHNPDLIGVKFHEVYVLYTSGSTGRPKGVRVTHKGLSNYLMYASKEYLSNAIVGSVVSSPLCFDATITSLFTPLCEGKFVELLVDTDDALLVLQDRLLNSIQPLLFKVTPAHLSALDVDENSEHKEVGHSIVVGGEQLALETLLKWKNKFLPEAYFFNEYGPTETVVGCCVYPIKSEYDLEQISSSSVPIGHAISNTKLYVLGNELELLPQGVVGELYIGGDGVAIGYIGKNELNAQCFIDNPFDDGRLYKTGDLVKYLDDGRLEFIKRVDEQIKIHGFRIESGEIEYQIAKHPAVNQVIVTTQKNQSNQVFLVAYFTSSLEQSDLSLTNEILNFIKKNLPGYMIPSRLMRLEKIPLNANGKVNRSALPKFDQIDIKTTYLSPNNEAESVLVKIWSNLLKIPVGKISTDANFFDLGGHSLLTIRLLAEIRAEFECDISVKAIFETPILSDSAKLIQSARRSNRPEIIVLSERTKQFQLSFAQQRLWFIDQMDGHSSHYNMSNALRVKGEFDINTAELAFNQIIDRHESLRTVFDDSVNGPVQLIKSDFKFTIKKADFSQVPINQQGIVVDEAIAKSSQKPFDLSADLMLRVSYIKLNDEESLMLFNMHHIASDGWSTGVLIKEFVEIYSALITGKLVDLPELSVQYVDYAHWQRQWLSGEILEQQLSYWDEQLAVLPQVHGLNLDFERPKFQTYKGSYYQFNIDRNTTNKLKVLVKDHQVTLFMLIHAVYSILIARYSNETDVVIGTPVANRLQKEVESLIGFFVNTLVLRVDCSDNPTFTDFLAQVKTINLHAQENQDVPFEHLVDRINPNRSTQHNALFQIMLNMNTNDIDELVLPDVTFTHIEPKQVISLFDLSLNVIEGEELAFYFEYNTDLFKEQSIINMAESLTLLLESVAKDCQQNIAELPLLNQEQHYLLNTLNDTEVKYPTDFCIHELFEQQVLKTPDHTAVVFEDQSITYKQLNQRANQLAHFLLSQGQMKPDDFVGLCLERSIELVVGLLAILKAGGGYLPLDPTYPSERLTHMLKDSDVKVILSHSVVLCELDFPDQHVMCIDELSEINQQPIENIAKTDIGLQSDNLAYIIYTSGSTGKPKGAAVEHKNETNLLYWYIDKYNFSAKDKVLVLSAIGFDLTQKNLFAPLICGASLQFATARFYDVNVICDFIKKNQITMTNCAPSVFYPLVEHEKNHTKLNSLRCVLFGGEAIAFDRMNKWLSQVHSNFQLINMYGPTECTDISCAYDIPIKQQNVAAPIGTPNANVSLYVLNEYQQLTPLGVAGELCVGGLGVSRGYLNQPELTAKKFIRNPFSVESGNKIYRTGDMVRWNKNAELEFIGRIDSQVKIRGFRVELGEIEFAINSYSGIGQSVVIFDETKELLNAYLVVVTKATAFDVNDLRQYLKSHMPDYMIPSGFASVDELPLNTHGKIDKKALSKIPVYELSKNHLEPNGKIEIILVEIWSQLLKIKPEIISADGNFFELGGHSLLLTNMLHLIFEQLDVQLSVKEVFNSPTIIDIAKIISSKSFSETQQLEKQDNSELLPLSYGQSRIWFIEQLKDQTNEHNMPAAVRIKGELNIQTMEKALNLLISRHDILRTLITDKNNQPMQLIEPEFNYYLDSIDLSDLSDGEKQSKIGALTHDHDTQCFVLSQLPLISVLLLKVDSNEFLMHFNQHHIISDGWSQQLFYQELLSLYDQISKQKLSQFKTDQFNYADYAVWQKNWMVSNEAKQQESFWKEYLHGCKEQLFLPIQKSDGHLDGQQNIVEGHIDAELRNVLTIIGHTQKGSLFNVLHTGFILLLSRLTGENDFNIGLPVTGRHIYGTQNMLGMFLNTLPVRHQVNLDISFHDLLNQQINNIEQVLSNQDLPLEEIFKVTECERNPESTPLFQILFNMLSIPEVGIEESQLDFEVFPEEIAEIESKFNITIYLKDSENGVSVACNYNNSAFSHEHIQNFVDQYVSLLSQLALNIDAKCKSFSLNETNLKVEYTDPNISIDKGLKDVTELFRLQAKSDSGAIAISDEFNEWTYDELLKYSCNLAHELKIMGVKRGHTVTIVAARQANLVASILATLQLGATYSIVTTDTPTNRVLQHMEIVGNSVTLLCEPIEQYNPKLLAEIKTLSTVKTVVNQPDYYQQSINDFVPETDLLDQVACVTFTSGSSGIPKAVSGTHLGLCGYLDWVPEYAGFSTTDYFGMLSGLTHDPLQRDIFGALCTGATLVIPAQKDFDAFHFSDWIKVKKISVLHLTPAMAEVICMEDGVDLTSVKVVFLTGETLRKDTVAALLALNSKIQIFNCYGATETQRAATYYKVEDVSGLDTVVPISLSTPDTSIKLINQNNDLCGIGEIGMICTESSRIAKGYLNDSDLTKQRFKLFKNGQRRYMTGDLGVCIDGNHAIYLGRQDSQVNIRGFRVELGEIEYQLSQYESVKKCTVQVHDNAHIIAYVVINSEKSEGQFIDQCKAYLEENLPQYMLPSTIMILDQIPLTENKKVDRKGLPSPAEMVALNSYQAPDNEVEIALSQMWSHLLKMPLEKISINSNFFEMGGHSLLLLKLIAEIRHKFEIEVNLKFLFESKDLQSMADLISSLLEQAHVGENLANVSDEEIEEIEF